MEKYDDIVVGSGISGLSMAQLLALQGRKILLIEKAPIIGGSLARFSRKGIPFDTGFHFTGGYGETRTLHDMQTVLGIDDDIKPIFLDGDNSNKLFFEDINKTFFCPQGVSETINQLTKYFPHEESGIRSFFEKSKYICKNTRMLDLREMGDDIPSFASAIDEDFISLTQGINELVDDSYLKSILCLYCLCYGTKPDEVSFATHCRISLWLFKSVARVENGGDAFISAFKKQFIRHSVDIKTKTYIEEFSGFSGKRANIAILNTGEQITFDNCILAIHPKQILNMLPQQFVKKGFRDRVSDYEESNGFFCVHGYLENYPKQFQPSLNSILSSPDLNKILDPQVLEQTNLVVMTSNETVNGKEYKMVNAFESSFYENVKQFDNNGKRSQAYEKYKKERTEQILERMYKVFPEFRGHLRILESASMLTFKDYLYSPYGSAYGIKQKVGQFNLLGRLPVRNFYAIGQSALLPGLLGGMMSSFAVLKSIIGKESFQDFIDKRLEL